MNHAAECQLITAFYRTSTNILFLLLKNVLKFKNIYVMLTKANWGQSLNSLVAQIIRIHQWSTYKGRFILSIHTSAQYLHIRPMLRHETPLPLLTFPYKSIWFYLRVKEGISIILEEQNEPKSNQHYKCETIVYYRLEWYFLIGTFLNISSLWTKI